MYIRTEGGMPALRQLLRMARTSRATNSASVRTSQRTTASLIAISTTAFVERLSAGTAISIAVTSPHPCEARVSRPTLPRPPLKCACPHPKSPPQILPRSRRSGAIAPLCVPTKPSFDAPSCVDSMSLNATVQSRGPSDGYGVSRLDNGDESVDELTRSIGSSRGLELRCAAASLEMLNATLTEEALGKSWQRLRVSRGYGIGTAGDSECSRRGGVLATRVNGRRTRASFSANLRMLFQR
jgi:hypothetical protein